MCDTIGELPLQHELVGWLQQEVLARLASLDEKLGGVQSKLQSMDNSARSGRSNTSQCLVSPAPASSPWRPSSRYCHRVTSKASSASVEHPRPTPTPSPPPPPFTCLPPCIVFHDDDSNGFESTLPNAVETRSNGTSSATLGGATLSGGATPPPRRPSAASCQALEERSGVWRAQSSVRMWNFLYNPESSRQAAWYSEAMPALALFSVATTLLQTGDPRFLHGVGAAVLETFFEVIFLIELLLRFVFCPNQFRFLANPHNTIDLLAVLPLALRAYLGFVLPDNDAPDPRGTLGDSLLCIVPILRLLKTLRHFERFRLVIEAVQQAFEALPILLFSLMEITLVFASLIFLVEPRDNIESLPRAIWLTIVTMTTVGYGDVTPSNTPGSIIVSLLVIMSVLYMAMPLGIVGQTFVDVWSNRDGILLRHRTQERLKQWGYTARDVLQIFYWFDQDGSGLLEFQEFEAMVEQMRLGLGKFRIRQLFDSMAEDGAGSINAHKFVRFLYPVEYYEIFDHAVKETERDDVMTDPQGGNFHIPSPTAATVVGGGSSSHVGWGLMQ